MGPERVLPSSEDELGEEQRPVEGGLLPGGAVWSGGEEGGEMELDEEEEEEVSGGGYYYQPLNQEPDGLNGGEQLEEEEEDEDGGEDGGEAASHSEQMQQVQQRIEVRSARQQKSHTSSVTCLTCTSLQVMGLHLPEAPSPDSDEEEDPEGAAAQRSRASIPMDAGEMPTCLVFSPPLPVSLHHFLSPCRPRGAGEEDDGDRGATVSRRAAVGSRDLGRPVEGHGPKHAAEPGECRCPAPSPPRQRPGTMNSS